MKPQDYILLEDQFGAHNYKPLDTVLERGEGIWVWDVEGTRYMDCLSAYSAINQGHCNPRIMDAMLEQSKKLTLTSRAFRNDQLGPFSKELCDLTNSHKILLMNSGSEAVETALKAVRKWGYKLKGIPEDQAEIIVCHNNFHGRTITIISFSTSATCTTGFGPFTPGFTIIEFGDAAALEQAITNKTVAFLVEPIQGEAGVIIPPRGYLQDIRKICSDRGVTLIFDEIQTGLGRTGKLLAEEHENIEADLTLIGKALSGGFYPISAVLSNAEVLGVFKPGEHGSTFGGNPLACAIGSAALKALVEDGLIENSAAMGEYFIDGLRKIHNAKLKEIRGRGLLIAVEFLPEAKGARQYCEKLKEVGLLCKETHENIIRFAPPLTITRDDIDWALERIIPVLST